MKRCIPKKIGSYFLPQGVEVAPWQASRGIYMSAHRLRRGVVVSGVRRINEVNARRARLVPGWVTVFGRVYRLGM